MIDDKGICEFGKCVGSTIVVDSFNATRLPVREELWPG